MGTGACWRLWMVVMAKLDGGDAGEGGITVLLGREAGGGG